MMRFNEITDWDSAYAITASFPNGLKPFSDHWQKASGAVRERLLGAGRATLGRAYGASPRQVFDVFLPEAAPLGVVVFVHGGYWYSSDGATYSYLAKGSLAHGFAFAVPTYRLCPEVRISAITADVAAAVVQIAGIVDGPIYLVGHSAGGHLVSRMVSATSPLPGDVLARVRHTVSISGLHDLRPFLRLRMNQTLNLDAEEVLRESAALLAPAPDAKITAWVGGLELPEFLRQNELLANIWLGLGARTAAYVDPGTHHYTVIDGLSHADHPLTRALLELD